jgi:hypothetical protein
LVKGVDAENQPKVGPIIRFFAFREARREIADYTEPLYNNVSIRPWGKLPATIMRKSLF